MLLLRVKFLGGSPLWAARNLSLKEASKVLEKHIIVLQLT